jgi:hypothetical protein
VSWSSDYSIIRAEVGAAGESLPCLSTTGPVCPVFLTRIRS